MGASKPSNGGGSKFASALQANLAYFMFTLNPFAPLLHYVRLALLRVLLTYKGWMTSPNSSLTKAFFVAVKFLSAGTDESLMALQPALPRLPLGNLDTTCKRYLKAVEPLLTPKELEEARLSLEKFKSGPGRKLQLLLWLHSINPYTENWLAEMWLKVAYLRVREPLPLASSYFSTDGRPFHKDPLTTSQAERCATLILAMLNVQNLIVTDRLQPLKVANILPICQAGFQKILGTTRLPGKEEDILIQNTAATSVAVGINGKIYIVKVIGSSGKPLTKDQIRRQFQQIIDEESSPNQRPAKVRNVCALTSLNRTEWYETREMINHTSSGNATNLEDIESSLFFITLQTHPQPADQSVVCDEIFHNNAHDKWFDKSFVLNVYTDGGAGLVMEHSFADGAITGQWWEDVLIEEMCMYEKRWTALRDAWLSAKKTPQPAKFMEMNQKPVDSAEPPRLLVWDDVYGKIQQAVDKAEQGFIAQTDELAYRLAICKIAGKETIKKCRVSPDGFTQLALQLAFYRLFGYVPLTYQPVSMRQYRHGRTETNRSMTTDAKEFVMAMGREANMSRTAEDKKKAISLLKTATTTHQANIREAMLGNAPDRHLSGLRVLASVKGIDTGDTFNGPAFNLPWELITTSCPIMFRPDNTVLVNTFDKTFGCIGGGFATIQPGGIGAAYFFYDDAITLHISVKKGGNITKPLAEMAKDYEREFESAAREMLALFDGDKGANGKPTSK